MTTQFQQMDSLEFPRLSLYVPAPGTERERSSLGWSLFNGNPRCTVWTRIDDTEEVNGRKKGPISAGIGAEALEAVYTEAMRIFGNPDLVDTYACDVMTTPKGDSNTVSYEKVLGATLIIGRGDDGICFIGLKSADSSRPQLTFHFNAFDWHPMRRKSGPIPDKEMSTIHARAYFEHLKKCLLDSPRGQTREELKAISDRRKAAREARQGNRQGGGNFQSRPAAPKAEFTDTGGFGEGDFSFG